MRELLYKEEIGRVNRGGAVKKQLTFATFKKHCQHRITSSIIHADGIVCEELSWTLPDKRQRCNAANCPVWKRLTTVNKP